MNEEEMVDLLTEMLELLDSQEGFAETLSDRDPPLGFKSLTTFEGAGLLTRDHGLVLRLESWADKDIDEPDQEFHITIQRIR